MTSVILKQELAVTSLECEIKRIQQELMSLQKERQELENHRKAMKINANVQRKGMVCIIKKKNHFNNKKGE